MSEEVTVSDSQELSRRSVRAVRFASPVEDSDDELEFMQTRLEFTDLNEPVDANWEPEEDYYVHIDVLHGSSTIVSAKINSFMVNLDSYDPRRSLNFPTDLLEENEKDTKAARRRAIGIGSTYYELWKVRRQNFSVPLFGNMVQTLPRDTKVRLVRIIDNEHEITNWTSKKE